MANSATARRWFFRLLVLGAIAAAVWWGRRELFRREPLEVSTLSVQRGDVASTVTNSKAGTVRARRRAKLSPEVGGRIAEIFFREGDRVEAGEVLFRLDNSRIRAELAVSENALAAAVAGETERRVAMDRAERALNRKRGLAEERIVTQDLLDELESTYALSKAAFGAASAEVERARAAVALVQTDVERMNVRAPFSGVVAEVDVELGEWVTPSPSMIQAPAAIDLIDPDSLYISAPMDEVDSASIHPGQSAIINVDSHQGVDFAGKVARVAPYVLDIEQQNRTVEIEVGFTDLADAKNLLPGTSADVEVVLETHEGVVRLPTRAIFEGESALVVEDGVLARRELEIGLRNWDWIEILSGLEPGELVVDSLDRTGIEVGAPVTSRKTAP